LGNASRFRGYTFQLPGFPKLFKTENKDEKKQANPAITEKSSKSNFHIRNLQKYF
jgi:hypothetical protein